MSKLSKLDRESMAGPKPVDQPGFTLYAKLNHNRFGSHYVWVYRKENSMSRKRIEMIEQGEVISQALREIVARARRLGCKNPKLFFEPESAAVFVLDGDHEGYTNIRARGSERQKAIVVEAPVSVPFDAGGW